MGKKPEASGRRVQINVCSAIPALSAAAGAAFHQKALAGQTPKAQDSRITVRYTDVRKEAGITFLKNSTKTEEKYYLETLDTGEGTFTDATAKRGVADEGRWSTSAGIVPRSFPQILPKAASR
jgi:hypothetical protein